MVLMRRTREDLRMPSFHGNFFVHSVDLLAMPTGLVVPIEIQIKDNITAPFVVL